MMAGSPPASVPLSFVGGNFSLWFEGEKISSPANACDSRRFLFFFRSSRNAAVAMRATP